MKTSLAALAVVVVALAAAAGAFAKGADRAVLTGPGLDEGFVFAGQDEPSLGSPLSRLVAETAIMSAIFTASPNPTRSDRPAGNLGPKYTITYRMPAPDGGNDRIRQRVYPYAKGGPVLYTKPGQRFFETERTHGGWYVAHPDLKTMLVKAGLPPAAPAARSAETTTVSREMTALVAVLACVLLLAAGLAFAARRRVEPGYAVGGAPQATE